MSEEFAPSRRKRQLVLGVVIVGTFMAVLDISIVNVALPQIMTSFGVNVKMVKWVSTSFLLTTAACVPLTGWLGRRLGLGRLFQLELMVFTAGTALCMVSWSLNMLIVSRVIQALGAGALMPTSMAIITDTFPPAERGKALGTWGIGFMLGPAVGPTAGGYLMEWFDWRAIYAINLPVGLLALTLAVLVLNPGRKDASIPFDFKGYLALVTFIIVGLLTLDYGQDLGWDSQWIRLGLAVTAASFQLFIVIEWDSQHPVLPLRLLRRKEFAACVVLGMVRPIPLYGALFMLPLFLQQVQGRDTIETGLLLVPAAVMTGICMPLAGLLTDRFGPRWPTVLGAITCAYSLYLFTALDPLVGVWTIVYPQFWRGIGVSLLMTSVNTAAMNAVPRDDVGTASWVLNLTLSIGGAFTIGVLGTMLSRETMVQVDRLGTASVLSGSPPLDLVHQAMGLGYSSLESGQVALATLLGMISRSAYTLAFQNLYAMVTLITLAGVLPALFLATRSRTPAPSASELPPQPKPPAAPVPPAVPAPPAVSASSAASAAIPPVQPGSTGTAALAPPGVARISAELRENRKSQSLPWWRQHGFRGASGSSGVSLSRLSAAFAQGRLRRAVVMGVVMTGPFLALLEGSSVNVALPSIMTTFGVNINQVKWVATAFLLSTAVAIPLTGWLGRRIGLGRAFLLEMLIFISGSALSAISWNLDVLVVARVVEAIGAGSLMPTSLAIVTSIYPATQRGKAIGIWGIGFMLAPALGPTFGGFITEWFEWRAIFGVNLLLGIGATLTAAVVLERGDMDRSIPFDWKGYLALSIFLVVGLLTLNQGRELGWDDPLVFLGAALSLGSFAIFLALAVDEEHPILPLRLFRNLDFTMANWIGMTRAVGLFGSLFLLPVFLQNVQGLDPITTGMLMMPAPLMVAATMPVAGILTDRFGPRWLTITGILLVSYSLFLYAGLDTLSSRWTLIYPQIWRGIGMGLINTPVSTAAMNAVERKDVGHASWIITLTRMVTASAVIALVGTLLPSLRRVEMDRLGAALSLHRTPPRELLDRALKMGHGPADAARVARGVLLRHVSNQANVLAFQRIHMGLALAVLTGLVPAFLLRGRRVE